MELELRKCFMMGVRYIFPFVFYGGLLISLIFLIPESDTLYGIGNSAFNLMIMALVGYISYFITNRAGLYPGILDDLMSLEIGAGAMGEVELEE